MPTGGTLTGNYLTELKPTTNSSIASCNLAFAIKFFVSLRSTAQLH